MYVVHNDTDWPVLVASVAGVEVGKLVPPHSTWQVRPPDERRLTATNEPVCLQWHEQISTTLNRYTHDARDYAGLRARAVFAGLAADDLLTSDES